MKTKTIWRNDNYSEWIEMAQTCGEYEEKEINAETFYNEAELWLGDERMNLDKEVDGYIVCFANLGLWNGRVNGAKEFGTNIKNILTSNCDYVHWYCDRYNVRSKQIHHDGTNYLLYRMVDSLDKAMKIVNDIAYHGLTEKQFMKRTKSIKKYIDNIYGW